MSSSFDWDAAMAEIDETIAMLQTTKEGLKYMRSRGGGAAGVQRVTGAQDVANNEFLGMGIPEAAKKFLEMIRLPQTVGQIHEAIKSGGLPHVKYNAVYNALSRREAPDGDFARAPGSDTDWGLAAWWQNNQSIRRKIRTPKTQESSTTPQTEAAKADNGNIGSEGATDGRKRGSRGGLTLFNGTDQVLRESGRPLHADVIVERLGKLGKDTNMKSLTGTLPQDIQKRFENLGSNVWALKEWAESVKAPFRKAKEGTLPL